MGLFKKKRILTSVQLRVENKKLSAKHEREEEHKRLSQENFRLKHRRSLAFARGVGRVGEKVGKHVAKKVLAPPKNISPSRRKMNSVVKPIKIGDFI